MKVFYCRNCGFFHEWKSEKNEGENFPVNEYEGFSQKSIEKIGKHISGQGDFSCPVCSAKGYFSRNGSTVKFQLTGRKSFVLTVRKFYFPQRKE